MSSLDFSVVENVLNQTHLPRLQIVGELGIDDYNEKAQKWRYELVYEHFTEGVVKLNIGIQNRYGGFIDEYKEDGKINPPMRIKADSKWDSIKWNMPLFYIFENEVEKVELEEFKEQIKDKLK